MPDRKPVRPVNTGKPLPRVENYDDTGRILMERDSNYSKGNQRIKGEPMSPESIEHLLSVLNINLQDRIKNNTSKKKKPKNIDIRSRKERLSGLFGGNR
jgi:hypothetical protein